MSVVWGLEAQTEMQKRLEEADLGHLRMDIVNPCCGKQAWGGFNDRPLNEAKVEDLRAKYHSTGPLCCQADKVIYLPMRPTWFEGPTLPVIAGKYVNQVPILKLTAEGKKALASNRIRPLSGNHRREALCRYHEDLVEALKLLNDELGGLEGEEKAAKEAEIEKMSKRVEDAPFWTIKIYDLGASFFPSSSQNLIQALDLLSTNDPHNLAFTYLSENDTLPSSRAAEEDSLHAWCSKFVHAEDLDREIDRARRKAGDNQTPPSTENYKAALKAALQWAEHQTEPKYSRILSCPFSRLYFLTLSRMPAHYRAGSELKMRNVISRQENDFMGVSSSKSTIP